MSENQMEYFKAFDEFAQQYKIVDKKKVYTNGGELIPIFRVRQWLIEASSSTDCISREAVMNMIEPAYDASGYLIDYVVSRKKIAELPPVIPTKS